MGVQLNHTIIPADDAKQSATWLAELMDLGAPQHLPPFWQVTTDNGVNLDYMDRGPDDTIRSGHFAFLITEDEFDTIFGRIVEQGLDYYADPHGHQRGEINHHDGGRGVYFPDPSGHWFEIITRPYGSWS